MTTSTDAAREDARTNDGRFGAQPKTDPEVTLPTESAPHSTFDIPVDEVNAGDTLLVHGVARPVTGTWVSDGHPDLRVIATPDGNIHLDREDRAEVVRTGNEPNPEDHEDFVGYCRSCGRAYGESYDAGSFHIHPRGGRDYDADNQHVPWSYDPTPDIHILDEI